LLLSFLLSLVSYAYGIIQFRDLTSFLRYVSIHPDNQRLLLGMTVFPDLLSSVCESFRLFVNDCPEATAKYDIANIYGGGGGKDTESLEYLIEFLLQLSFAFHLPLEKEKLLYVFQSNNLSTILKELLALPTERNISVAARLMIRTLLDRLELAECSIGEEELEWEFQTMC
jgi:hypothetical protein